jgi:hypothetical protein
MIQGRLERLFSDGFVEGFAWDIAAPERTLKVEVRAEDGEAVGAGLAHLYRDDLAEARVGLGWCGFRLRLSRPVASFQRSGLSLYECSRGERIDEAAPLSLAAGGSPTPSASVIGGFDPFSCESISTLRACDGLFDRYVRTNGLSAFVRGAYLYVLDRRADPETLALNLALLVRGALTPLGLLQMLADGPEFRSEPRRLTGPKAPEFPFSEPAHVG